MKRNYARFLGAIIVASVLGIAGCAADPASTDRGTEPPVRIASLKGPTTMGLVGLMEADAQGTSAQDYEFTVEGMADAITAPLAKGDLDFALVPVNLAATLHAKTNGAVQFVAINTLGVLYAVTGDDSVQSIADLAGRTVYTTGKGTTPQYVIEYLLSQAGVADQVTLDFRAEAAEAAALLAANPGSVAILPEPYVTTVTTKNESLRVALDLNEAWRDAVGSPLVTGSLVVRTAYAAEHPEAVATFLTEYQESVAYTNEHPDEAAVLIADRGIVPSPEIAKAAIPRCHIVYLAGEEGRQAALDYLTVLAEANPAAVGGAVPGDSFFYAP